MTNINKLLNDAVNNKKGQIRISKKQAIWFLNSGFNGDTSPSLMREDLDSPLFHGLYKDDIECLDNTDNIQLWF